MADFFLRILWGELHLSTRVYSGTHDLTWFISKGCTKDIVNNVFLHLQCILSAQLETFGGNDWKRTMSNFAGRTVHHPKSTVDTNELLCTFLNRSKIPKTFSVSTIHKDWVFWNKTEEMAWKWCLILREALCTTENEKPTECWCRKAHTGLKRTSFTLFPGSCS